MPLPICVALTRPCARAPHLAPRQDIKRQVLSEGALQPVINLLSSPCSESQREAALLLGQFATTDNGEAAGGGRAAFGRAVFNRRVTRVGRLMGARLLHRGRPSHSPCPCYPRAAFKARIAQRGAIPPLIRMLSAADTALREMAAFALGRLAQDSENQVGGSRAAHASSSPARGRAS